MADLGWGQANSIVAATIAMGHHLGLEIVAEGVETTEQAEVLWELGCDAIQCWLFAPALDAPDAAAELPRHLPQPAAAEPKQHLRMIGSAGSRLA